MNRQIQPQCDRVRGTLVIGFVVLLCVAGCKTSNINPKVAQPGKGYVDFYQTGVEMTMRISKQEEGEIVRNYSQYSTWNDVTIFSRVDDIVRIEEVPGVHTFRVEMGSGKQTITVTVYESKITPVNVDVQNYRATGASQVPGNRMGTIQQ